MVSIPNFSDWKLPGLPKVDWSNWDPSIWSRGSWVPSLEPTVVPPTQDTISQGPTPLPPMHAGDSINRAHNELGDFSDNAKSVLRRTLDAAASGELSYINPALLALALQETTHMLQQGRIEDAFIDLNEAERKYTQLVRQYTEQWKNLSEEERHKEMVATAHKTISIVSSLYTVGVLGAQVMAEGAGASIPPVLGLMIAFNLYVQFTNITNTWDSYSKPVATLLGTDEKETESRVKQVANLFSVFASLGSFAWMKSLHDGLSQGAGQIVDLTQTTNRGPALAGFEVFNHLEQATGKGLNFLKTAGLVAESAMDKRVLDQQGNMKTLEGKQKQQETALQGKTNQFNGLLEHDKKMYEAARRALRHHVIIKG